MPVCQSKLLGGASMNVGQLLRSLLNDAQPGEPKTLELKVGQIVKGLVLQLLSEQDALVNIGGVQVKAHLETPLKQGDVTMLQVQPESNNGQITLKPLANSTIEIVAESLADVLSSMGLKDTSTNRQIIQTMHQANIPLTKENSQTFAKVLGEIPPNIDQEQWQQSALLALKNNLPLSKESVSALQQVVYGEPINQQLNQLSQLLEGALTNPSLSKQVSEALTQVKVLLNELQTISTQAFESPLNDGGEAGDGKSMSNVQTTPVIQAGELKNTMNASANLPQDSSKTPTEAALGSITANSTAIKGDTLTNELTKPIAAKAEGSEELNQTVKLPATTIEGRSLSNALNPIETHITQSSEADSPQWIGKWLKSLGIEHEQQLFKALDKTLFLEKSALNPTDLISPLEWTTEGNRSPNEAAKQVVTDSLKAALLQLNAFDDTPPAIKESAQQLLQQITGQQLLLSSDRTSMFSHITLMIPMNNEQGQQTAAVHIQSRKGSRGEIDANNCRLVFDLRMKSIGDTLVDVQVFNKIVSLHVHNDHDFVANLLEGSRAEIAASLQNVGYQFLSLKCSPFPEEVAELSNPALEASRSTNPAYYASKPYKGVDLRV
jgi:hypothetical protein